MINTDSTITPKTSPIILPNASGRFGRPITDDHNQINALETDDKKFAKIEMWVAKQVGQFLCKHLPNREWGVKVDGPAQMMVIVCDSVSHEKGYHISMHMRTIEELQRRALKAAQEILERHGLPTGRAYDADITETLQRDVKDNVITKDNSADPVPIDVKPTRD